MPAHLADVAGMNELSIDNSTIPPLTPAQRWYAAKTVCDEARDEFQAAYVLQMLGLIERGAEGGYVPSDEGGDGETWYPPSPLTPRCPTVASVLVLG